MAPKNAKPPEKMTKSALLDGLARKLSKDEIVSLYKAVSHGYAPFTSRDHDAGEEPGWYSTK